MHASDPYQRLLGPKVPFKESKKALAAIDIRLELCDNVTAIGNDKALPENAGAGKGIRTGDYRNDNRH